MSSSTESAILLFRTDVVEDVSPDLSQQFNSIRLHAISICLTTLGPLSYSQLQFYSMTQSQSSFTMAIQLQRQEQSLKCEQCGLPAVSLSTSPSSNDAGSQAYYKCVPCNRFLGPCPRNTSGASQYGDSDSESSGSEDHVPRGLPIISTKKQKSNPHPAPEFDEDWEANCSPGFMVSRFKAQGREVLLWP
ncbi:hypothetical protein DTO027I6_4276 [Penicillium roqueforti]|nr:uncharacterized protein LCP9604111_9229 [Penicillium roqueforti]KAF9239234.1 hypothetical protein LCP9604111_9229 [Penicillium roqueforti]KAI3116994.1 hypothetical protein CBS147330_9561 [Penicillium roqueforti]KAI3211857.1 hypothetical protein DTO027I6_4276 [Penicillium roqueforti]